MRTLITHARVVSPGLDLPNASVLIEGDRIVSVTHSGPDPEFDQEIDAAGLMLMPGFIDIHSHGADGRDACDDSLESIRHIARKKLQEGVTTWLPTTLTQPRDKLRSIAEKIAKYREKSDLTRCPGMHLEGPFISKEMAGAQNPQFIRPPDFAELEDLHNITPVIILSLAPELPGALQLIDGCRALGITCSGAHTSATAAQILAACHAGLTHLTHFGNAMTALHHREIGAVGAGMADDRLMLELICDGVHLSPDMLWLIFKTIPHERLMMITDSTAASWLGDGQRQLGGLDVIVENRIARLKGDGALAGSTLLANRGLRNLVEFTGLELMDLVATTSWNQARSLGFERLGKISPGYFADLVLLEKDFTVARTIVGGETR